MIRSVPLTQLVNAVDSNLPAGTIVLDPSGNSVVFYKYKGTLLERDTLDFNESTIRSRIKHSCNRGSTLAIKIHPDDDISQFFTRTSINPEIFNRTKITQEYLDTLSSGRDDLVILDKDYRLVFLVNGENIPNCLQPFVANGDLVPLRIT